MNCVIDQGSLIKRYGTTIDRTLVSTEEPQIVTWFQGRDKTAYTVFLTQADICKRNTSGSQTYTYITPQYTTGTVDTVTGTAVVGNSGTNWKTGTDLPAAGDKFVINADYTSTSEPAADWATIASVGTDTSITLSAAYAHNKTTGTHAYTIRKVYTTPTDERWTYAIVANKFCFSNGNTYLQYWNGTDTTVANLDSTHDTTTPEYARYMLSYANRLFCADVYLDGQREPWTLAWCKEGGPSASPVAADWTDTTAGSADFVGTKSVITGLGRVVDKIIVYKHDSIILGNRTGISTAPVAFPRELPGIGCIAPYSIIQAMGTNFFRGNDDFYVINGDSPKPIGAKIRDKFASLVSKGDQEKIWGVWSSKYRMLLWFANTSGYGQLAFAYDYNNSEWLCLKFSTNICGAGEIA